MTKTNVLFIELENALTDGKPFDALVAGEFVDGWGTLHEFKARDLPDYITNTQEAIEATRTESGEVVGLPIDANGHENGDGAGWIIGIELVDGIVRVVPKWTHIGKELIEQGIRRFFSASVDIMNKVILGGSLTNWPATRNKKGVIQLRPIELSEKLCEIVEDDGSREELDMAKANVKQPETVEPEIVKEPAVDLVELRANLKKEVLAELQAETAKGDTAKRLEKAVELEPFADIADLSKARDTMVAQMETAVQAEFDRVQADAANMLASLVSQMKRDQHIAEFAQRVVSGTESRPYGLPVGQEEVETVLLSLNAEQRGAVESILARVHEQGLVQFSEIGHGKKLVGVVEFPAEFSAPLATWLADGNSKAEFFAVNSGELGNMAQYNLDEYEEKA